MKMEKRNLEQRCATNFCFRLNENATETYEKLQQAYGEHAVRGHRFLDGIKHFWMAVWLWKTKLVLEDLARQKYEKMWPKWGLTWGVIDVWQSEWSVVIWIWISKPSTTKLVPKNLTNEQKENRRNVCLDFLEHTENDDFFFSNTS